MKNINIQFKTLLGGTLVTALLLVGFNTAEAKGYTTEIKAELELIATLLDIAQANPELESTIRAAVEPALASVQAEIDGDMMMDDDMMDEDMMDYDMVEMSPAVSQLVPGAAGIFHSFNADSVFVSSNTSGEVTMYDTDAMEAMMYDVEATDSDGVAFMDDMLYMVNRSDNRLDAYEWDADEMEFMLEASSDEDEFMNGRELAMMDDMFVVAEDASDMNDNQNALVVFEMDGDDIEFVQSFDVDINLWGIHAAGNDLHAIVDNSNQVAVFEDFFDMDDDMMDMDELEADMMVTIEGITRTHGLDRDAGSDTVVFTDIGSADSDSDGALVIVYDFMSAAADGMVSMDEQIRIESADTMLGNPVDVALDYDNEMIYVAERANMGGQMLVFELPEMQ